VTSDLERRWGIDFVEGKDGESIYDHWREGPKTLHGMMTHGFPNQFFIGYIQGAANSSVTEQFGEQGRHIAHVIAETMKRGAASVEVTAAAQEEYVRLFEEIEYDSSVFLGECTPSYFNNEGEKKPRWALFKAWGRGWEDFQSMVAEWRDKGDMDGLELTMPDHHKEAAE
jgi:cyclohexanone monooxygenase